MSRPKVYQWIENLEIRCKILSIFIAAFLLISIEVPLIISLALIGLLTLSRLMGLPWNFIGKKLLLPMPFLIFMALPLLLGEGLSITQERLEFTYLLVAKGLGVFLLMMMLVFTQEEYQLVEGLRQLPIPKTLSAVLVLSFRYVHVWTGTLKKTYRSSVSRGFEKGWNKNTFKVYGEMVGGMILRSLDQSQRVHKTMLSRGFSRDIPIKPSKALGKREGFWIIGLVATFTLLKVLEMRL